MNRLWLKIPQRYKRSAAPKKGEGGSNCHNSSPATMLSGRDNRFYHCDRYPQQVRGHGTVQFSLGITPQSAVNYSLAKHRSGNDYLSLSSGR